MAALLAFHLIGLYPTPISNQLLIGSPMISEYTINNNFFGTKTTITVKGFDQRSLAIRPPDDARIYVKGVTINGKKHSSICWVSFEDVTGGGHIEIEVDSDAVAAAERGCGGSRPDSLEN